MACHISDKGPVVRQSPYLFCLVSETSCFQAMVTPQSQEPVVAKEMIRIS